MPPGVLEPQQAGLIAAGCRKDKKTAPEAVDCLGTGLQPGLGAQDLTRPGGLGAAYRVGGGVMIGSAWGAPVLASSLASSAAIRALRASFSSRASRAISLIASSSSRETTSRSRRMR